MNYKANFDHPYNSNQNDLIISNYVFSAIFLATDFKIKDLFYPNVFKYWKNADFEVFSKSFDEAILNKFGRIRDRFGSKLSGYGRFPKYNLILAYQTTFDANCLYNHNKMFIMMWQFPTLHQIFKVRAILDKNQLDLAYKFPINLSNQTKTHLITKCQFNFNDGNQLKTGIELIIGM